jgi:hypothetical protein
MQEAREREHQGCKIRVTVDGFATQWNWKGKITFPDGQIDQYLAPHPPPPLPNTKEAAFSAGFKCGEARIARIGLNSIE